MDENTTTPPPTDPTPPMQSDPAPTGPAAGAVAQPVSYQSTPMTGATSEERSQAMLMWIIAIFASLIGPLIFFVVSKEKPFVYRHSATALTWTLVQVALAIILAITIVGMLLIPLIWIAHIGICIYGAIAANNGRDLELPVVSGLTRSLFKV